MEWFFSNLLTPVVIVVATIWVNTTIRRKSKSDSVLVDYVQQVRKDIDQLVRDVFDANDRHERTLKLRALSNELCHLQELQDHLGNTKESRLEIDRVFLSYFDLKRALTETDPIAIDNRELANKFGNSVRLSTLKVIFSICEAKNNK